MTAHSPVDVFESMHTLVHAHRQRMRAALQPQLTPNELRALLFVGHHPMRTQKDLGEHSGADKAQITRMLNTLQARGWLERVPHARDARSRCLALSPAGQAVFEHIHARRRDTTAQLLQGFTPGEQAQLQSLLGRLLDNLETQPTACATRSATAHISP